MRRDTHPRKTDPKRWRALRRRVFDAFNWRCAACGRPGRLDLDHIEPLRARPDLEWSESNLQPLCSGRGGGRCHLSKTSAENELHPDPERAKWKAFAAERRP